MMPRLLGGLWTPLSFYKMISQSNPDCSAIYHQSAMVSKIDLVKNGDVCLHKLAYYLICLWHFLPKPTLRLLLFAYQLYLVVKSIFRHKKHQPIYGE